MKIIATILLSTIMMFALFSPSNSLSTALGKKSTALDALTILNKSNHLAPYVTPDGVAVVTGGNSGIGAVSVATLALAGMKVVLCARNVQSAQDTKQSLPEYCRPLVDIQELDLADLNSVEKASKAILAKYGQIDLLLNNAGVMAMPQQQLTAQGVEMQFGTNHVGHHFLTRLLVPSMKPNGRVVTVASTAHTFATGPTMDWEPAKYSPWGAYGRSKLANILFAKRLQDLMVESGRADLTSVSLHPGVIGTSLWKFMPWFLQPFKRFITDKTIEQGAATNVFCSLTDNVTPGAYYSDCQVTEPTATAQDVTLRKQLWEYTEALIANKGFVMPESLVAEKPLVCEQ
jgi:retinol dehydrogenase 12